MCLSSGLDIDSGRKGEKRFRNLVIGNLVMKSTDSQHHQLRNYEITKLRNSSHGSNCHSVSDSCTNSEHESAVAHRLAMAARDRALLSPEDARRRRHPLASCVLAGDRVGLW